ncbi:ADP-heptose--lipopolysaccharide heptosyltransferase, putative [Citrifermentans bemidjiense Bem]|uniref:ADP-heptose--lipopolysaccharide heptosyltransferase, putative n=1 Tax=Citrifermentans bemidjiense (strain ATCC BAA-1014 / DSM 16622 / JCM 12645 / Bem) TaxID=404380 RepID=B5EBX8_CITBB|nr:glycosyltransferase family 9 protein [Citrifermentans bemidjiense]ACH39002.1 ADP-heptose--lipopolysaccharide heptosyltransferase, putative [Citrifermentans bemidjiense Bem]
MKATLLKRLDAAVGPLFTRLLPKRRLPDTHFSPRSFLVIRPGGIGDAVLLVPALSALQKAFPGCRIDVLAESRNAAAFLMCPGLNRVYRYDSLSDITALFSTSFDVVIDTEQWYRLSAVIARLVGALRSIGFSTNDRGRLFTDPVPYPLQDYELISFFKLLAPLEVQPPKESAAPFLQLPAGAKEGARRLLAPLAGKAFVAIFPGASVPEKQWGRENFRQVAESLTAAEIAVVVVGADDARASGDFIARGGLALNLAGKGGLMESAAVLAEARVLLSGDSGLLHIAAGLGTATVSLFGPSDAAKWAPKGERHTAFSSSLSCAPCSRYGTIRCSTGARCLDAAPTEVTAAVLRLCKWR